MNLSDLQQMHGMLTEVIKAARVAAAQPEASSA
jgi:hypothetical protein